MPCLFFVALVSFVSDQQIETHFHYISPGGIQRLFHSLLWRASATELDSMNLLFSVILFASLGYEALATPIQHRPTANGHKKRTFRVERIKHNDYVRNSPGALSKAYNKFGITADHMEGQDRYDFLPFLTATSSKSASTTTKCASSASASSTADVGEEGTVSATSVKGGSEYVSPVLIGGQNITMDFDTGSADM